METDSIATLFRTVFKSLMKRYPELVVPIVNEMFRTDYPRNVAIKTDFIPSPNDDEYWDEDVGESSFGVVGTAHHISLIEYKGISNKDILPQLAECGMQKAVHQRWEDEKGLHLDIPNIGLISLGKDEDNPSVATFDIKDSTSGKKISMPLRSFVIQDIDFETLKSGKWSFLIPFQPFCVREQLESPEFRVIYDTARETATRVLTYLFESEDRGYLTIEQADLLFELYEYSQRGLLCHLPRCIKEDVKREIFVAEETAESFAESARATHEDSVFSLFLHGFPPNQIRDILFLSQKEIDALEKKFLAHRGQHPTAKAGGLKRMA